MANDNAFSAITANTKISPTLVHFSIQFTKGSQVNLPTLNTQTCLFSRAYSFLNFVYFLDHAYLGHHFTKLLHNVTNLVPTDNISQ